MILVNTASFPTPTSTDSITCHQMLFEKRLLFIGFANGKIMAYRRRVDSQGVEQIDSKPLTLEGHSGTIRCLLLVRQEGLGQDGYLLFSGSADRTVRVWDPSADPAQRLVQTLRAHEGTVTCLAYADGVLVTASTDNSIKVWKQDEGRELLLYPWFTPLQTLGELGCWVNDIAMQLSEVGALYVGDEHGGLSAYKIERTGRAGSVHLSPMQRRRRPTNLASRSYCLLWPNPY